MKTKQILVVLTLFWLECAASAGSSAVPLSRDSSAVPLSRDSSAVPLSRDSSATSEVNAQDFYHDAGVAPPKVVSARQLSDWLANKAVVLIDLRGADSYQAWHLRGAINVPIELLTTEHPKTLVPNPRSRIVVYCFNNFMPTRGVALTTLGYPAIEALGYKNVFMEFALLSRKWKIERASSRQSRPRCWM